MVRAMQPTAAGALTYVCRPRLEANFSVNVKGYVGPGDVPCFKSVLSYLSHALKTNEHLRMAYYPIWAGNAHCPLPSAVQKASFTASFDSYLAQPIQINIISMRSDYGFTHRPKPGENPIIRINRLLITALEEAHAAHSENTPLYIISALTTVCHEMAHTYGFFIRAIGYSPIALSQPGRSDAVPKRDVTGKPLLDDKKQPIMVQIGEGGYIFEARFLGSGATLCLAVPIEGGEDAWDKASRLELRTGLGAYYPFSKLSHLCECISLLSPHKPSAASEEALSFWTSIKNGTSTTLVLGRDLSNEPVGPSALYRHKSSECALETHSPEVSPTLAAAVPPQAVILKGAMDMGGY